MKFSICNIPCHLYTVKLSMWQSNNERAGGVLPVKMMTAVSRCDQVS